MAKLRNPLTPQLRFNYKMLTLTPQFAPPQLMADLKKENFSLKLKIYYLETTLSKVSGVEEFDVLAEVRGFVSLYVLVSLELHP